MRELLYRDCVVFYHCTFVLKSNGASYMCVACLLPVGGLQSQQEDQDGDLASGSIELLLILNLTTTLLFFRGNPAMHV